ncbi:MAG: integrase arm-type DNA-binding domain-containing protein [Casimicrobiaceae bacterium]
MVRNLLTDRAIRNAKPRAKDYRLRDGDGLFVLVAKTGGKSFQYRYKLNGVGQTATLKEATSLADARRDIEPLRRMVAAGEHPRAVKRREHAVTAAANAQTFAVIAAAWVKSEARRTKWSEDYINQVKQSLANHLSELDPLPISSVVARVTAPVLHAVEVSAPMMEEKVARRLNAIMDFAVELGALELNPLPRRRRGKVDRKHFPAVTHLPELGEILRAARAADPCKGIQRAHVLLAFTAQRVGEIVGATWDEVDLHSAVWAIPRDRMKRKDVERGPHQIPIPPALMTMLREWREADGPNAVFVCPAPRNPSKPITPEALEKYYRNALNLAGRHSPHSWRSAFSTVAREAGKDGDTVEAQLDHVVGSKVASAYDRSRRLDLRRELMRWYETQLIAARDGKQVVASHEAG